MKKKYLLDTHALIWAIVDDDKLSKPVLKILQDTDNQLYVSAVSFWEIAIKFGKGKLYFENFQIQNVPDYCNKLGIEQLPLMPDEAINYSNLPYYENHKDPFDRMLIYQCIRGNYTLLSRDEKMIVYKNDGLECIW
jgi:PIN domain nuclease of toxin-antitoxin system